VIIHQEDAVILPMPSSTALQGGLQDLISEALESALQFDESQVWPWLLFWPGGHAASTSFYQVAGFSDA
jgi:hypothetical protein